MRPDDIAKLRIPGRPVVTADGAVVVAVSVPDPVLDRYTSTLRLIRPDGGETVFTQGPRDTSPVLSPDGHTVVFLRAGETGPAQLYRIDLHGGEATALPTHPLGASPPAFSADGRRIAYRAAVPEPGRYGTDPECPAEAEAPRVIDRMAYRVDGKGFLLDRPEQIFLLELDPGSAPQQLTADPELVDGPVFLPDGRIGYLRRVAPDLPRCEVRAIDPVGAEPGIGTVLAQLPGNASQLVAAGDHLYYLGVEFEGIDLAGRTAGLWSMPVAGAAGPRRLTGPDIEVDSTAPPVVIGDRVLVSVLTRGTVSLHLVAAAADRVPLAELPAVISGPRVVASFSATRRADGSSLVVAGVTDPSSPGELVVVELDPDGIPVGDEQVRTDLAAELRPAGLAAQSELTAIAPDGYPVHGFLVLPPGAGSHPVLLVVHGGPHAAHGWGLFDEAQVYAAAGYAVVLPNPRGSAGYGLEHGRTVLGRLGTVDVDDVLALLDAALERPDCDASRVGVMGGSYGGFITSWLASQAPQRFTAAISERAVNAWDSFAGSSDIGFYFAENYVGVDRDSQWRASPLAYAQDIAVPLLIIHSEHDWRCPIEQAQRLYVALKRRGAPTEMLLFPSEGHELSRSGRPRHRVQRFQAILDWWGRYLPVGN